MKSTSIQRPPVRRERSQLNIPATGLGYTSKNINGLQTYEYTCEDKSPIIRQAPLESSSQTTFFSNIDWSTFLAPGKLPPPITKVPEEEP